ncbi:MAG: 50S ribosomal protein L10 [Candidatus Thermoplasmatota archaeon]|jgi:large subunit ribosomal protein L10|nr:50S ribosomal protein L10 [Candidatus Thermoplasmatota archaeon]MCL5984127.1 50S ribosomal protein L10 [Candidatus Thermoplasmatota archaeon]
MASAAVQHPTHVSAAQKLRIQRADHICEAMLSKKVVSLVGFRGVPASNLQGMRQGLRTRGHYFLVAPNSQIVHALAKAAKTRPKLAELVPLVTDQTALLISESNPFALFRELKRTRNKVAPKGGETAPEDVMVHAGETSFKPGPIVGELQHAGFPAAIEKGKVVIKKDTVVVKKGTTINREVAQMLARLEIKPIEVGLMLRAAVEEDTLYQSDALSVDFEAILGNMVRAKFQAVGLALAAGYVTSETLPLLLVKAKRQADGLALKSGFISADTIASLIGRAAREANALKGIAK